MLKNKVRALLAKYEYQCPVSHIFSNKGTELLKTIDLSWTDRMAVDAYLDALVAIKKQTAFMVLLERDYNDFVINLNRASEKIIPTYIRVELLTSSLLFIGYSLEDINFRAIFQGFLSFLEKDFSRPRFLVHLPPPILNDNRSTLSFSGPTKEN